MGSRSTPEAVAVAEAFRYLDVDVDVDGSSVRPSRSGELITVRLDEPDPGVVGGQIVVRDRVTRATAHRLREAGVGWLDLSGHLSYRSAGLVIDADVPGVPDQASQRRVAVLGGAVVAGLTIAALARWPEPLSGVRATARELGVTAGGVSAAVQRLVEAGYMTADRRATASLFWAAADEWRPDWVELPAGAIAPGSDGVVTVGALAASELGAPIAVTTGTSPEYLVATSARLKYAALAAASGSEREGARTTARYAVAPSPIAARLPHLERRSVAAFPVAAEAVVALSLALDPARGAETVREWAGDHVWN